jgi:hypothetical protein
MELLKKTFGNEKVRFIGFSTKIFSGKKKRVKGGVPVHYDWDSSQTIFWLFLSLFLIYFWDVLQMKINQEKNMSSKFS